MHAVRTDGLWGVAGLAQMEAHGDLDDDSEEDADFDAGADSGADEDDDESGASDDEDEVGAPSASTFAWTFCGRLCLEVDHDRSVEGWP